MALLASTLFVNTLAALSASFSVQMRFMRYLTQNLLLTRSGLFICSALLLLPGRLAYAQTYDENQLTPNNAIGPAPTCPWMAFVKAYLYPLAP